MAAGFQAHESKAADLEAERYLNEHGCAFGQVNRTRVDGLVGDIQYTRTRVDAINRKIWGMLLVALGQAVGLAIYLAFQNADRVAAAFLGK